MHKDMNPSLRADILREIDRQFGGKEKGQYINKIQCPACGKREAFTNSQNPWVIKCGRLNNCGEHFHVKELFEHLFESWTERYQPKNKSEREKNPTAVADGYLRDGRGFDLSKIKGWYTQEWYQNPDINEGSTTVRFAMPNGFWERVLDKPERFGKLKARAVGNYKGLVWCATPFSLDMLCNAHQIIITEGVFDAISWIHAGFIAISNISSNNYPGKFLDTIADHCHKNKKQKPKLVWAQDADKAGRNGIKKFHALAKKAGWESSAAQPDCDKYDWNDLHQLNRMGEQYIERYFYNGELLLAQSATAKAMLMYKRAERREFWFNYETNMFWFKLDLDAYDKEVKAQDEAYEALSDEQREEVLKKAGIVRRIATAIPKPLYFQENEVTNEQWYYFSIETDEGITKLAFTPKQLTSTAEFKNRLLAAKNAWWVGAAPQLEQMLMDMTHNLKTVKTVDFVGYTSKHKTYVFNDVAIKDGRAKAINSEDYFNFGRLSIKTLASSPELQININKKDYDPSWSQHVAKSFGTVGMISCAFWLGSLFAEQIRSEQKSYPFFELVGEAGAGKSTLIEFLWKLYGRDSWEGTDPQKATAAARARLFSQVSNLPVVLIESDREGNDTAKAKQFDWDDLKTAYNGRAMRSRGVKNSGNDTYEPPFRGSVFISQNEKVMASDAILSRICHMTLSRAHQNADTKQHAEFLERVPIENVSYFIVKAAQAEKYVMALVNQQMPIYEQKLLAMDEIRMTRIAKNHAQLMSFCDCLGPQVLNVFTQTQIDKAKTKLIEMALERQVTINSDHEVVQDFWEAVDFIDSQKGELKLNHFGGDEHNWAINLKEFERWCGEYRLRIPDLRTLKQHLKASKSRRFIDSNKAIRSKLVAEKTIKCWVFSDQNIKNRR